MNVWEAIAIANRHPRVQILQPGPGVGEQRWRDDDASPLLEIARREGLEIAAATP